MRIMMLIISHLDEKNMPVCLLKENWGKKIERKKIGETLKERKKIGETLVDFRVSAK